MQFKDRGLDNWQANDPKQLLNLQKDVEMVVEQASSTLSDQNGGSNLPSVVPLTATALCISCRSKPLSVRCAPREVPLQLPPLLRQHTFPLPRPHSPPPTQLLSSYPLTVRASVRVSACPRLAQDKAALEKHLKAEARRAQWLILWLDCDREARMGGATTQRTTTSAAHQRSINFSAAHRQCNSAACRKCSAAIHLKLY